MKKFGLSKEERIKLKKLFALVYANGTIVYSRNRNLKAIYYQENCIKPKVKVAFAVYKKLGNAVWRNRVKRLLREAYRQNKQGLISESINKKKFVLIVFSPNNFNQKKNKKIFLKNILPDFIELMNQIKSKI